MKQQSLKTMQGVEEHNQNDLKGEAARQYLTDHKEPSSSSPRKILSENFVSISLNGSEYILFLLVCVLVVESNRSIFVT